MGAIAITDCTVTHLQGTAKMVKIVTPATADDGDTIDVTSLFDVGCNAIVTGATDLTLFAVGFATTITIPGSTDNEARTIIAIGH